jgi:hypothetical protein
MSVKHMSFPDSASVSKGYWQPVYFRPNLDTPERLVAAVIANVDGEWYLARASALDRLKCLYGNEATVALNAIDIGLNHLQSSLGGNQPADDITQIVSGLELGDARPAQAKDARDLALRWIRTISSLHSLRREFIVDAYEVAAGPTDVVERDISRDRLPALVMTHMAEFAPQTKAMFNPHVRRLADDPGARLLTHRAYVAFTGKHVAANFATLKPGRQKIAVDISKRLMWDLEQHRDAEENLLPRHSHEMILYHPAEDDPTITPKQFANVMDVVSTLQDEGHNKEIKVLPYVSVPTIAEHILQAEGFRPA